MRWLSVMFLAFGSGCAVMILEIVGARFLAQDFGSSLYVWTSQIGAVLVALSLGYASGGLWADRFNSLGSLTWLLLPAGVFTCFIPEYAPALLDMIVDRHPLDREIPALWQRLDPALGSLLVFLPPCFVLALVPPVLIRRSSPALRHVGRVTGAVYAAGSVGSIAGVFLSGYVLLDVLTLSQTFQVTGLLVLTLSLVCLLANPQFRERRVEIILRT